MKVVLCDPRVKEVPLINLHFLVHVASSCSYADPSATGREVGFNLLPVPGSPFFRVPRHPRPYQLSSSGPCPQPQVMRPSPASDLRLPWILELLTTGATMHRWDSGMYDWRSTAIVTVASEALFILKRNCADGSTLGSFTNRL
ncbi:unnamed protein product [Protopolystoma xenopodis]|uniref:Uncharacterized protein n=1 Tax=Protopolystoma xenopodis TaxID=117903 RepID=A0A3S5CID1_9PLAT|nr:unnamed protein product [Protopolystoma xenopodis]